MKLVIYSEDRIFTELICNGLRFFDDIKIAVCEKASGIEEILCRGADAVIVSVCSGNTRKIGEISDILRKNNEIRIFLVGDDISQAKYLYLYKCDYFLYLDSLKDDIGYCIEKIKKQIPVKKLKVSAFGRFEVFYGDEAVKFYSRKAKELFALCVDHAGKYVYTEEAADKLWPKHFYDENVKQLYRRAVNKIISTLSEYGAENVFIKSRGACRIDKTCIECDYFDFLDEPEKNRTLFHGEYMFEYPWSEPTVANLEFIAEELDRKRRI